MCDYDIVHFMAFKKEKKSKSERKTKGSVESARNNRRRKKTYTQREKEIADNEFEHLLATALALKNEYIRNVVSFFVRCKFPYGQ